MGDMLATSIPGGDGLRSGRSSQHPSRPTVHVHNFPAAALPVLAEELRTFGAEILFESDGRHGELNHFSGRLQWEHLTGDVLMVAVIEQSGHFPVAMLIGGIRQTCQEAAERWRKQNAGA
jgi:hypothetical protein